MTLKSRGISSSYHQRTIKTLLLQLFCTYYTPYQEIIEMMWSCKINPHLFIWGPCRPLKTVSGAYSVIFGISEWTVYLIVHRTKLLHGVTNIFTLAYVHLFTGSIMPQQVTAGYSLIVEWCWQFRHLQTLRFLYQSVFGNINWWISNSENIPIMPTCIIPMANSKIM